MSLKIQSIPATTAYLERVRKNDDSTEKHRREESSPEQQKKEEKNKERFDLEKLGEAVDSFSSDITSLAYGLSAVQEGKGPGLRVILKDGSGAVVRQFTGEEFLQLREAASSTGRGKILDKKL